MNAQQTKALIDAARKAREALLALDPDSIVALELWTAIHRATRQPVKPSRTRKIGKAQYGPHVWRDGKCLDADDARTFANMVHARFYAGGKATTLDGSTPSYDPRKAEREAQRERLSYCVCEHRATSHRIDSDDNVLECSECDCQQFRYPAQMRNADVIQLTEASVSAEPSVIDKLRAITEERGATKDEVIAAQQRIIALMQKEAA
jgi:hypothetical protein